MNHHSPHKLLLFLFFGLGQYKRDMRKEIIKMHKLNFQLSSWS